MRRTSIRKQPASGFTLVELLVVIAIIGTLVALLFPAIQASREAARAHVCRNNSRQLAIASLHHVVAHSHFPTGGWGASWTGDPDRGYDARQPGGWTFNILPFLEQSDLHDLGAGSDDPGKKAASSQIIQQPMELFLCPTRRPTRLYPLALPYVMSNADPMESVARSDYAINAGDQGFNTIAGGDTGGPTTLKEGDTSFAWRSTKNFTGVSYLRSKVRTAQIIDGTSRTYLIGEKSLSIRYYENGLTESDRGHLYIGFAPDTVRLAFDFSPPREDSELKDPMRFGSAHTANCFFAFCDGSVRAIDYEIDGEVHRQFGNRRDGN